LESTAGDISADSVSYSKFSGFVKLTKFRLGGLVVFSAIITYLTVVATVDWMQLIALSVGGFLVTSAANGFNQIIEKDLDRLMDRTRERPMPTEVLSIAEALIFCSVFGISGTVLLWIYTNPLCGIIGFVCMVLYALVYTPLKQKTPFAVFVGAFPGALPTLIGGVATTHGFGEVNFFTVLLFFIQFIWQFPHFWSLAWFNNEDYEKANFHLLPSAGGKDDFSKFQILMYSVFLLMVSIFPFVFGFVGLISTSACVVCGLALLLQAYNFYRFPSNEHARKLFLLTLIYLPLVQIALMTKA
jgi:protoheme IX farnesyltransferase